MSDDPFMPDVLPEDILDARDIFDDEGEYDDLDFCAMGEHDFEPVMYLLDGVIEIIRYECVQCGAIDC